MKNNVANNKLSNKLIDELLADPEKFYEKGKAYALLQQFFRGCSITKLKPLLTHHDNFVRRAAIFVISELGKNACSLLADVVPLIQDDDNYVQYHTVEIIAVCAFSRNTKKFLHVIRALESPITAIRQVSMRLVSNAEISQLEVSAKLSETLGSTGTSHKRGLALLLNTKSLNAEDIIALLSDEDPIVRKYAAISMVKLSRQQYELLSKCLPNPDPDIEEFVRGAFQ